jgi:hypothetical protein
MIWLLCRQHRINLTGKTTVTFIEFIYKIGFSSKRISMYEKTMRMGWLQKSLDGSLP